MVPERTWNRGQLGKLAQMQIVRVAQIIKDCSQLFLRFRIVEVCIASLINEDSYRRFIVRLRSVLI